MGLFLDYYNKHTQQEMNLATVVLNYASENSNEISDLDYKDLIIVLELSSENDIINFINQIMFNRNLSLLLLPHISKLLSLSIQNNGISLDNWSHFSQIILDVLKLPDIQQKRSSFVSEFLSGWKKERLKLKSALGHHKEVYEEEYQLSDLIDKEWKFLRIQGRTVLFKSESSEKILAIKIQKEKESIIELFKQKETVNFLNKHKKDLKLQSQYPSPRSVAKIHGMNAFLVQLVKDKKLDEESANIFKNKIALEDSDVCFSYLYETEQTDEFGKEDYFIYLHNPNLTADEFFSALKRGMNDIFRLFQNGMIYHQLADLFHDVKLNNAKRKDKGHYLALTNLFTAIKLGSGEVENYLKAVEFLNLRLSGAADEGDWHKIESFLKDENSKFSQKFFEPKHKAHVPAELLGEILLVMELATISYAIQVIEKNPSKDTEQFWLNLGRKLCDLYRHCFSILSGMPKSFVQVYFNNEVWNPVRYAKQMRYFMTHHCIEDLMQGNNSILKIQQSGIIPSHTNLYINPYEFDKYKTFIDGNQRGPDSGPESSQHLVKEGDFIRYSFVTFYLSTMTTVAEFRAKLREAKHQALSGNSEQAHLLFSEAQKINPRLFKHFAHKIEDTDTEKEDKYKIYRNSIKKS